MTRTLFAHALHNDACPLWLVKLLAWTQPKRPDLMVTAERIAGRELTPMEADAVRFLQRTLEG